MAALISQDIYCLTKIALYFNYCPTVYKPLFAKTKYLLQIISKSYTPVKTFKHISQMMLESVEI